MEDGEDVVTTFDDGHSEVRVNPQRSPRRSQGLST